jgi:hypothetical protein
MNGKTNKLVIPALIIGSGVALYFLNKSGKLDKIKALISGEKEVETTNPVAPVITSQTTVVTSNPLGDAAAVKKFQEYYNSVKPANLPALSTDGNFGPLTAAAYNSYKDKYAAAAAAGKLPEPPKPPATNKTKVEIADLLATNAKAADSKPLYAGVTGIGIFNLNNIITEKTKSDTFLGIITNVLKTSNISYKITFIKGTGIKYYINYYTQNPNDFYVKI